MKFYGIRNVETKIPVGFFASANTGGEFCVDVEFSFDWCTPDNVWLVTDIETAKKALASDTKWYNAGYNSPNHCGMRIVEHEVFEVNI